MHTSKDSSRPEERVPADNDKHPNPAMIAIIIRPAMIFLPGLSPRCIRGVLHIDQIQIDLNLIRIFMTRSQKIIDYSLEAEWDSAVTVRETTAAALQQTGYDDVVIEAVTMCITELTENAVKYGNDAAQGSKILASVHQNKTDIIVSVSNSIEHEQIISPLVKTLDALREAQNPGDLHIQRMREIMKSPKKGSSRLGIYRIAYEGDFKLGYKLKDGILTVEAKRKLLVTS